MNGIQAIQAAFEETRSHLLWFLSDFSDADMFVRPHPAANHAAWQVGNISLAEVNMIREEIPEAKYPELPAGFLELHGTGVPKDGPDGYMNKADSLSLFESVRAATIALVGGLTDEYLDRACRGSMASFAPTIGKLLILTSNHTLMHGGQIQVIRRVLGKPILF
jgi:hypothetical protein